MKLVLTEFSKKNLASLNAQAKGAYIFSGPESIGKCSAALQFAKKIVSRPEDIVLVATDKSSIGIDAVHELRRELNLKTANAAPRVVVINNAHLLTTEAQNALLKTLEEPPIGTIIILVTHVLDQLALTVRSRCQLIRFTNPSVLQVQSYMKQTFNMTDKNVNLMLLLAANKIGTAAMLMENPEKLSTLKLRYAAVRRFAGKNLFAKLVDAQELAEYPHESLVILLRSLRAATHKAVTDENFKKAGELNSLAKQLIKLLEYLDANGNKKLAMDMAAIRMAAI